MRKKILQLLVFLYLLFCYFVVVVLLQFSILLTNKTDCHNITEILLKLELNTYQNPNLQYFICPMKNTKSDTIIKK